MENSLSQPSFPRKRESGDHAGVTKPGEPGKMAPADFKRADNDCVQGLTQNKARVSDQYKPEIHAGIAEVDSVISELKKHR